MDERRCKSDNATGPYEHLGHLVGRVVALAGGLGLLPHPVQLHAQLVWFGRIAALEIESPNLFVNLVCSGCTVVQSDNATEP